MHNDELEVELVECNDILIPQAVVEQIEIDDEGHKLLDELLGLLVEVLEHSDSDEPLVLDIMLEVEVEDGMVEGEHMIMIVITIEDDEDEVADILGLHQLVLQTQLQLV